MPQAPYRRPFVHLTHLFNHCLRLSHSPQSWKETKIITLPKTGKDPKFLQNLRPICLLSTTGKLFEKVLEMVQKHTEERGMLNASQFGFRACHSTTLQCMRLTDHVPLNFNNISTGAVFLDIEKAFDSTWHPALRYKLSKLQISTSFIKFISSFLLQCKFSVSVEEEMSTPWEMRAGVAQVSVISPTLYNIPYTTKMMPSPNTWCSPSPLCRRRLSVCERSQGGFYCQKTLAWSQINGDLV
jgi:hypothetical protein